MSNTIFNESAKHNHNLFRDRAQKYVLYDVLYDAAKGSGKNMLI